MERSVDQYSKRDNEEICRMKVLKVYPDAYFTYNYFKNIWEIKSKNNNLVISWDWLGRQTNIWVNIWSNIEKLIMKKLEE